MKLFTLLFSIFASTFILFGQKKPNETLKPARSIIQINSGWTFNYFPAETSEKGFEGPGYNDSRWPVVSLPHTWNSYESTKELSPLTKSPAESGETTWWLGWGWYRKHFILNDLNADQKLFLEFDGVQKYCRVWINGKQAGEHKGGYGMFDFDITDLVRPGQDNVIAVAVSYLQRDEFRVHPSIEGKGYVSCGIYSNVRLVFKNRLYIPMQGSASHEGGTWIFAKSISGNTGSLSIVTWVKNDFPEPKSCVLQATVLDNRNNTVQVIKSETIIKPGQLFPIIQTGKSIPKVKMWTPDDPYLYTVRLVLLDKKEVIDSCSIKTGFRNIRSSNEDNSFLVNNDKKVSDILCWQNGFPWLGAAVPEWMTGFCLKKYYDKGNADLISSNGSLLPERVIEIADSLGILINEDFADVFQHGFSQEEQKQQILEMVRRDRNHPSIASWSFGADSVPGRQLFPDSEDSLRRIRSNNTECSYSCFSPSDLFPQSVTDSSSVPKPAKLILAASSGSIPADKASLVVIRAYIGDAEGRLVRGMNNALKWVVSGPATFAGPTTYFSYSDSIRKVPGSYFELPAYNIVRSSSKPGKISVSVFAAGIASSSIEFEAVDLKIVKSNITEPVLAEEGRKAFSGNQLVTQRLETIPKEIGEVTEDFNPGKNEINGYIRYLKQFIKKNNPQVDTTTIELNRLSVLLANQMAMNDGGLSSADFNYNSSHFNTARLISTYISRTKLPALFKEGLRRYYSDAIIARGIEKNAGDEMDWLNWIPSGGVVVVVADDKTIRNQAGVIYSKENDLQSLIQKVYPQFGSFSLEGRERALLFIAKMNPALHSMTVPSKPGEMAKIPVFTADKGEPVLIPDLRFISE